MSTFEREVHANRGLVVVGEDAMHVALDNACLARANIAHHNDLEQMLPRLLRVLHEIVKTTTSLPGTMTIIDYN